MRALLAPIVLSLLSAAGAPAGAAVFKCAGDGGRIVYQDVPCGPSRELRDFATDPPPLSVIPGTPTVAAPRPPASRAERAARSSRDDAARQANDAKAAERKFVRSGMSEAEIVHRIGRPDVTSGGGRKAGRRWAYLPAPGDPNTMTTVTLQGGSVVDVERKVIR
ncbi:MAG: DUF4124 domain-containing protein [Casimicrobiaceae bacterium]